MLHSLKKSISKKLNSIVDILSSPSNQKQESEGEQRANNLKRGRVNYSSVNEARNLDMLVTPPEKRLKKVHEDIGRTGSSFKDLITATKKLPNSFIWRYVVSGETAIDANKDGNMTEDNDRVEVNKKKVGTDLSVSSSVRLRKTEEPKLTVHGNQVDVITKQKALASNIAYKEQPVSSRSSRQLAEVTKSVSEAASKVPEKESIPSRCVLEVFEEKQTTYATWNPPRRVRATDTVIRLEERDRYKRLLSQYTSTPLHFNSTHINHSTLVAEGVTGNPTVKKSDTDASYFDIHKNRDILLSPRDHNFSRLQHADSILKKFSSALAEVSSSNPVISSAASSSNAQLFREATEFDKKVDPLSTPRIRECQRLFSGADTSNISRNENSSDGIDSLGNAWTSKWRKILQEEELHRQKQIQREEMKLKSYENKRKERERELLKKIEARKDLDRKKAEPQHPPLTDEMRKLIFRAWKPGNPQECLVDAFNVTITRHDLATLADLNWLNDEVVNFYFHLLQERSKEKGSLKIHFFNSFFYPKLLKTGYSGVRRWTKKVDIFSVDVVVLPVHLGMHWCLAAFDMRKKQIGYYDSLKGNNTQCLAALRNYIAEEHKDKKKSAIDMNEWTQVIPKNIPEQQNGCDCGVFTCKYAECLTRDSQFNFTQSDMPYFRERMVYEILTKKLL